MRIKEDKSKLEKFYSRFNEEERLKTRHGNIEYLTSMHYIHYLTLCLINSLPPFSPLASPSNLHKTVSSSFLKVEKNTLEKLRILEVGSGTGTYSAALSEEGYTVFAVEKTKHNFDLLRAKHKLIHSWQGEARSMPYLESNSFDIVLVFGPLYHAPLHERIKILEEARRVVKPTGFILSSYLMNEYAILTHGFKEKNILSSMKEGLVTPSFTVERDEEGLFYYTKEKEIARLNRLTHLKRLKLIAQDGAANYMREVLNSLTPTEYALFIDYHFATCEEKSLLGASSHLLDIVIKKEEKE